MMKAVERSVGLWKGRLATLPTRIEYFLWAARRQLSARSCPCCQGHDVHFLVRKLVVTQLLECRNCGLRYRYPKETAALNAEFYQTTYSEGISGQIPSETQLEALKAGGADFTGGGNHARYDGFLPVLEAAGLRSGMTILDYGCSWGWGTDQLRRGSYVAAGYDVSAPRAAFARAKLGVEILDTPRSRPAAFDGIVCSHVLEHLPNPNTLFEDARIALKGGGILVVFVPNGNEECALRHGRARYNSGWGKIHPLMLTSRTFRFLAHAHGFSADVHSSPYDPTAITSGIEGDQSGLELCCIARRL